MEKFKSLNFAAYLFIGILIAPLIVLCAHLVLHWQNIGRPFGSDFFRVFALSMAQSIASSLLSVVIGAVGAFGLIGLRNGWPRHFSEMILLTPSLFPALFVVVATLNLIMPWTTFPFGIYGVIIAHTLTNFGLITVILSRTLETKLGGVIEIATIEGASKRQMIWQCIRGLAGEMTGLFFFLFVVCFTSFSVPLILGGRSGATLEILIYRTIVTRGSLGEAVILALTETFLVFCFSLVLTVTFGQNRSQPRFLRKVFVPQFLYLVLFASILILASSFHGLPAGLHALKGATALHLKGRFLGTFFESFVVSLISFLFLIGICILITVPALDRFLAGYIAPSIVVTGFAIYLLVPIESLSIAERLSLISFGFAVLILPSLYRLRARSVIQSLRRQIDVARVEGAGLLTIFRFIIWPQCAHDILWICGLAGLWASGDFAFATLIAGKDITLALTAQTLLAGYRLELATVVMWLSLISGGIVFLACVILGKGFRHENT